MAYAEKRDHKLTGKWIGETYVKGKRFRRHFETKKLAEGYELFVKLTGEEPPTIENAQPTGAPTFAAVAKRCKDAGGPSGKWKNGRDPSITQRVDFCVGVIGHYEITQVNREVLGRITKALDRSKAPGKQHLKLSKASINRYLNAAGAVMTYAVQCGDIESKPMVPLEHEVSKKRGILTSHDQEDTILRLMEGAGAHVEALCVRVLVETGLRESELLERVRPHQIEVDKDGNGWVHLDEDQTKNNSARSVYIRADLAREIRAIVAAGKLPKAYRLLDTFKSAVEAAGYPANIVIHSLRHTRNTRLRKQGVDMKVRMQMLGHKSVAASMRYDHVDQDDQLAAAKKVENAAGDQPKNSSVVPFSNSRSA